MYACTQMSSISKIETIAQFTYSLANLRFDHSILSIYKPNNSINYKHQKQTDSPLSNMRYQSHNTHTASSNTLPSTKPHMVFRKLLMAQKVSAMRKRNWFWR
jgi:hypothetical protein